MQGNNDKKQRKRATIAITKLKKKAIKLGGTNNNLTRYNFQYLHTKKCSFLCESKREWDHFKMDVYFFQFSKFQ